MEASALIQSAYFTDAIFLWFPSQIALAALLSAAEQQRQAQPVLAYIRKSCPDAALHEHMMATLTSINTMLQQGATAIPDIEQAKELDRKLKQFNKQVAKEAKSTAERKRVEKEQKRLKKLELKRKRVEKEQKRLKKLE